MTTGPYVMLPHAQSFCLKQDFHNPPGLVCGILQAMCHHTQEETSFEQCCTSYCNCPIIWNHRWRTEYKCRRSTQRSTRMFKRFRGHALISARESVSHEHFRFYSPSIRLESAVLELNKRLAGLLQRGWLPNRKQYAPRPDRYAAQYRWSSRGRESSVIGCVVYATFLLLCCEQWQLPVKPS